MLSTLVKPTPPISKIRQRKRFTTGKITREIIPALTVKNSFILKEACSNTGHSNTDFSSLSLSASPLHRLPMDSNDDDDIKIIHKSVNIQACEEISCQSLKFPD